MCPALAMLACAAAAVASVLGVATGGAAGVPGYASPPATDSPVMDYLRLRAQAVAAEEARWTGASLTAGFTPAERAADVAIRAAKAQALVEPLPDGGMPLAAQHFFDAKPRIERTALFPLLRTMPKGAVLHTHPDALRDVAWVVSNATYDERLWVCGAVGTGLVNASIQFQFTDRPGGPASSSSEAGGCSGTDELFEPGGSGGAVNGHHGEHVPAPPSRQWRRVVDLREASSAGPEAFDAGLVSDLSLLTDRRPAYANQSDVWTKFQNCFGNVAGLFLFDEFHTTLMTEAFKDFRDDGVQHVEVRQMIAVGTMYTANGTVLPVDAIVDSTIRAAAEAGVTLRMQMAEMRGASSSVVATGVEVTRRLMQKYPSVVVGFDLVGQEDAGKPLLSFLPQLLQGSVAFPEGDGGKVPLYLHAGETDLAGQDPDMNLFDAVLLNSTRIGHGFALSRHADLRRHLAVKGVGVEVCPLSNQMLLLLSDLRDHPAATHWVPEGAVAMTISPDDPALWGAVGVTYDWFQFLLATGNSTGLGLLKQLVLNSWEHSALDTAAKVAGAAEWERRWDEWVTSVGER